MSTISSRVAVAVHVLAYMAWKRSEPVTSERIASSVNTNPVVVRRIVGALRNAGMVTVQPGVGGGAQLAREPGEITLLDVYRAVEDGGEELFSLHRQPPRRDCSVGGNIQEVLQGIFCRARTAMEEVLEGVTIEQVQRDLAACAGERCCGETLAAGSAVAQGAQQA
jgi:Rrf2 family protein